MQLLKVFLALLSVLTICCKNQVRNESSAMKKYLVYIGTYTEKESHVEGKASGIYIFEFDTVTGRLTYVNTSPSTINPSFITLSPDGRYLYSVNETGSDASGGFISAFAITDSGHALEFINKVASGGKYPCFIETDKTGKYAFSANYGTGNIVMMPLSDNGAIGEAVYTHQHEGKGVTSRQESAHAHSIRVSEDNRFVYSCDLGTDLIYVYELIPDSGHLKLIQSYKAEAGAGPRHLEFHPSMHIVYVINELNGTIQCLTRNETTGMLNGFQVISTIRDSVNSDPGSADIHITPTGEFLFASNRGSFNNIAMFSVDPATGSLSYTGSQSVKGEVPRNFAIDPTGRWLLVANQNSGNVVSFRIDPKEGKLIDTGIITGTPTPVCIKFGEKR